MIEAVLTVDDIPSGNTEEIVQYLNENGITAVMFAVGNKLEKNPDPAIYALRHRMIVGNHSYSHPAFSSLSLEEAKGEIEKSEELLDKLYLAAGVERKYRPFRFPYGDKGGANKDALQQYLASRGFNKLKDTQIPYAFWKETGRDRDIDTLWTFDFAEYRIRKGSGFTLEDVFRRIREPAPAEGAPLLQDGGNHILLMHAHDETGELVPEYWKILIGTLLDKGVTFRTPEFFPERRDGLFRSAAFSCLQK